jgi:CubicO group peptidase (beta-lactamase class C family)
VLHYDKPVKINKLKNNNLMKLKYFTVRILFLLLLFVQSSQLFSQKNKDEIPTTLEELQTAIKAVMKETGTPAVGLTLVNKDGVVLTKTLGKADVENDIDADENTMFRIASVSKMYVSLAILKLQEEGMVNLKDKVRDLVPEVEFENPWEETSPILVENLLEHTTGWADFDIVDYAQDGSKLPLKEAINFHPHSRVSRWIPGTRYAYSNSGPGVAAYIIEKITGQTFEDYIQETFFSPMGMKSMTYFVDSEVYKKHGAKLYIDGNRAKMWNILYRPSGAINATPKDMANMVSFFINRGEIDSIQVISEASLKRMETPSTTIGAKAGLEDGYGLSNFSSSYKNVVYRKHNGIAIGGLSDLSYLPEYNLGYAVMTNSADTEAMERISNLIRAFQLKDIVAEDAKVQNLSSNKETDVSGYYININPRNQRFYYLERLFNAQKMEYKGDKLFIKNVLGETDSKTFIQPNKNHFASPETKKITMVRAEDPIAGTVYEVDKQVLKPISGIVVFGQLIIFALWVFGMITAILFGIIWSIRFWMGKIAGGPNIWIRLWPLISSLFFVIVFITFSSGASDFNAVFGNVTLSSITVMVSMIAFALVSLWSMYYLFKVRTAKIKRLTYWYSATLICLHFLVTCYFLWWGVIGVPTWN